MSGQDKILDFVSLTKKSNLTELVNLHIAAFPKFFLTRMGSEFLHEYYGEILEYPGGIIHGIQIDGQLVGLSVGFMNPAVFYTRMSKRKLRYGRLVLKALLRQPSLVFRLLWNIQSFRSKGHRGGESDPSICEWSSIAIHPDFKRIGVGRKLAEEFWLEAAIRGGRKVIGSTDAENNIDVIEFHSSVGFVEVGEYYAGGGRRMIALEKKL
jgi:GNAT superfamily N-acetyltransferase